MTNSHCRTWSMARKLKNAENEKLTLWDLEYGEKTKQQGKLETHIVGPGIWQEN